MTQTAGLFITFEGGEGTGKSTQIQLLAHYLKEEVASKGTTIIQTREPGGSPEAEQIRTLLVEGSINRWSPITEALLMFASRANHWETVISPALWAGHWVLCDRFADSSFAYQGYGHGVDLDFLQQLYVQTVGSYHPDRTYIFDCDPAIGMKRTVGRTHDEDRFESMDLTFHERVRDGYQKIAENDPNRCVMIDATHPIEKIQEQIRENFPHG